jgi:hypothetical protein
MSEVPLYGSGSGCGNLREAPPVPLALRVRYLPAASGPFFVDALKLILEAAERFRV